jgi:hypothetical protein
VAASSVSGTLFPHLPQAGASVGEEAACGLRNVNAAGGNPMKMLGLCLAQDPPKCGRFGDRIMRSLNLERDRTQSPYPLLLIALRAERQAEGNSDEY